MLAHAAHPQPKSPGNILEPTNSHPLGTCWAWNVVAKFLYQLNPYGETETARTEARR